MTDANSCSTTFLAYVNQPAVITITDTVTNLACSGGGNTGAINIGVSGGNSGGGYSFAWSNSSTTQDISNLAAGTYSVIVTDTAGCSATLSAILSHSGNLMANPTVGDVSCFGLTDGSINLSPSGGTGPYGFLWNNSDTAHQLSNLAAGSYTITVTDQSGCTLVTSVSVTQPALLTATTTNYNVSCYGAANGTFIVVPSGGTIPYTFSNNDSIERNLAPGIYSVTITDDKGCNATVSDTVTQPDSLALTLTVTNASAFGANNGAIALTVAGGTAGYIYDWSNGTATQNDSNLVAASYCVRVTDQNSCIDSACAMVSQPSGIENIQWLENLTTYTSGGSLVSRCSLKMKCIARLNYLI